MALLVAFGRLAKLISSHPFPPCHLERRIGFRSRKPMRSRKIPAEAYLAEARQGILLRAADCLVGIRHCAAMSRDIGENPLRGSFRFLRARGPSTPQNDSRSESLCCTHDSWDETAGQRSPGQPRAAVPTRLLPLAAAWINDRYLLHPSAHPQHQGLIDRYKCR